MYYNLLVEGFKLADGEPSDVKLVDLLLFCGTNVLVQLFCTCC